jgi:hypothetical protein
VLEAGGLLGLVGHVGQDVNHLDHLLRRERPLDSSQVKVLEVIQEHGLEDAALLAVFVLRVKVKDLVKEQRSDLIFTFLEQTRLKKLSELIEEIVVEHVVHEELRESFVGEALGVLELEVD